MKPHSLSYLANCLGLVRGLYQTEGRRQTLSMRIWFEGRGRWKYTVERAKGICRDKEKRTEVADCKFNIGSSVSIQCIEKWISLGSVGCWKMNRLAMSLDMHRKKIRFKLWWHESGAYWIFWKFFSLNQSWSMIVFNRYWSPILVHQHFPACQNGQPGPAISQPLCKSFDVIILSSNKLTSSGYGFTVKQTHGCRNIHPLSSL